MFLFFGGTRVRHKALEEGRFHCPMCERPRVYERRRLESWVHAYWLPLFRVKELGEVIVCRSCGQAFEGPEGRPVAP